MLYTDKHADASIGNITGSNSVNVFLGLGLPWLIAALHANANGVSEDRASLSLRLSKLCVDCVRSEGR